MKSIHFIVLFFVCTSLCSQDTMNLKKKNFFVFNGDYLYNQYVGYRDYERQSGPSPSSADTSYTFYSAENTHGFLASASYRYCLNNHFFIQMGIGFRNTSGKYLHNDSIVNENNSPIISRKYIYNNIESPIYFGFQVKRISILSGIILPILTSAKSEDKYEDGFVYRSNTRSIDLRGSAFYISQKLQVSLFKKQNIGINIGADFSHEILRRYRRGYLINWNAGLVWMIGRKR